MFGQNTQQFNLSYDAPQSNIKISPNELIRWLDLRIGNKFKEPEEPHPKQIIAVNPYLSPEKPFFGDMFTLQAAPDGSLIIGCSAGLEKDGDLRGIGWWRIAPDGAITSFISRPYDKPFPGIHPSANFSVAPDGSLLTIFSEEIKTERTGTKIVRLHSNGTIEIVAEGLENPGMPIQDPKGNIWVSNKKGTELIRISVGGSKSENLIGNRNWSNKELEPQERISMEYIVWDPVNNELVVGGSFITSKPHDLHSSVWRISSEGIAKRVYYNVKSGSSPSGQHIDAIRALTIDAKGQIVLATKIMKDKARRQIVCVNEKSGKLEVLTGYSFRIVNDAVSPHYRYGHEEAPYDGVLALVNFRETKNICFGLDGTLFILDEHLIRRLDKDGKVRTWAF